MYGVDLHEVPSDGREARHAARLVTDAVDGQPEERLRRTRRLVEQGETFVLWSRGQAVAAVIGHAEADTWVIDALGVAPTRRGRGLGRELLLLLRERLAGPALVAEAPGGLLPFFEQCGFTVAPVKERRTGPPRYRCTLGGLGTPIGVPRATVA